MPRYTRIDMMDIMGLSLNKRQLRMEAIADQIVNRWKMKARGILKTTLREYQNNISIDDVNKDKVEVVLRGMLPNLVEQGMGPSGIGSYGPYDVRKFILPWTNPRTGKVQDHVAIPFRRTMSQIKGLGGSAAVKMAKKLGASRSPKGSGTKWGQRLPPGMAPNLRPRPDIVGLDVGMPTVRPAHATDPLAGLTRMTAGYTQAAGGGSGETAHHVVFRMMSMRGKPWISPGVRPRAIAQKVDVGAAIAAAFRVAI
jgi:hypothetical protein